MRTDTLISEMNTDLYLVNNNLNKIPYNYFNREELEKHASEETENEKEPYFNSDLNESMEEILNGINSGIMLINAKGDKLQPLYIHPSFSNVTQANDYSQTTKNGKIFDFILAEDVQLFYAALLKTNKSGEPSSVLYRLVDNTWHRANIFKIDNPNDKMSNLLLCFITNLFDSRKEILEGALRRKKEEMLLSTNRFITFEYDQKSHTITLPKEFEEMYDCKHITLEESQKMEALAEGISPNTRVNYEYMIDCIEKGEPEGTIELELRGSGIEEYDQVRISWKLLEDEFAASGKGVCVIEPIINNDNGENEDLVSISTLQAQLELQNKYFNLMKQYQWELRRSRHDYKNNIIAIAGLIKNGNIEDANKYIDKLTETFCKSKLLVDAENPALATLISEKLGRANELGIKIEEHVVGLPANIKIETMDLCLAVGCALDNAIDACVEAMGVMKETFIKFHLMDRRGVIVFRMENSSVTKPPEQGDMFTTTKQDQNNHGFGLVNIRQIVEKYNGVLSLNAKEDTFETQFTLFQ